MSFPLTFLDVSIWLGFLVVMLWSIEVVTSFTGEHAFIMDKTRLRVLAATVSILFLVVVALRIYGILA